MSYKNTTASTDDCSTKHPAANHGSPPGALRYEKVKLLCPVVQQIQTEGKTQKEGELELKSERAVKDLLCRARYKQAKTIPKQQERKPARTFLQPRAYPVKDWRGAAQAAPLLTKTLYSEICYPSGKRYFEYRLKEYIPQCVDSSCIGRAAKRYKTMADAIKTWNTRAPILSAEEMEMLEGMK